MGVSWEDKRLDERAAKDADQAEMRAVRLGSAPASVGLDDERIAGSEDLIDIYESEVEWANVDARNEEAVSGIGRELIRRRDILGAAYPFGISGNTLQYTPSRTLVYELCLAITLAPVKQGKDFLRLSRAFERLTCQVVSYFLGDDTMSYRTGYSGDDQEDRPILFKDVANEIYRTVDSGEWCWVPETGFPENPSPALVKDLGIDAVIWKSFPDRRMGTLFFLGNCACGDNWEEKLGTINIESLEQWFRPLAKPRPSRFFATPYHISNTSHFGDVNLKAGLTFDRIRMTLIAETSRNLPRIIDERRDNFGQLIRLTIPDFNGED